ncbi:MAG TPA: hypothetical protein VGI16_07755 [Candidatus Acidoferrum sp.]|jgi:hypothetical protein
MNSSFFIYFGAVLATLVLSALAWTLRRPSKVSKIASLPLDSHAHSHAYHLPQIARALAPTDFNYLSSVGLNVVARQLRQERRRIALAYLPAVKHDFDRFLRLARIIAVLSPKVKTMEEWERLRITAQFNLHYQWIRLTVFCGLAPLPQLNGLSQLVSGLAIRMDSALKDLGERAVMAQEMASMLDRRGVNVT